MEKKLISYVGTHLSVVGERWFIGLDFPNLNSYFSGSNFTIFDPVFSTCSEGSF